MTRKFMRKPLTPLRLGTIGVVIAGVTAAALFQKAQIDAALRPGETIEANFADTHRIRESVSEVKIAGVPIGIVTSVERRDDGTSSLKLKVDEESLEAMGTAPSARIRPATLLGGNYYVEVIPGGRRGEFSGTIPLKRTSLPVELDGVVAALPTEARQGVRSTVAALDGVLAQRGSRALRSLLQDAPPTLDSTAHVLHGLQGTDPQHDLQRLVVGVESTSTVLSDQNSQLGEIVEHLATTAQVLEQRSGDLALTAATMPGTLTETGRMLTRLDSVLDQLEATAEPARPAVRELARVLKRAEPVLRNARPVVSGLHDSLVDLRPTLTALVPTARDLHEAVEDVSGPVLERLSGPILDTVLSPWHGSGDYAGGGADRPFYKELGYMISNLATANMMDRNGSMTSFFPGIGPGSLAGLPISLEQLLAGAGTLGGTP